MAAKQTRWVAFDEKEGREIKGGETGVEGGQSQKERRGTLRGGISEDVDCF